MTRPKQTAGRPQGPGALPPSVVGRTGDSALGQFSRKHYPPPLEVRLKIRLRPARRLHGLIIDELAERQRFPLGMRLRALRRGFTSMQWRLYDLDVNDPADYLPSFAHLDFGLTDPHFLALRDKLTFARMMELFGVPHPRPLALIVRGTAIAVTGGGGTGSAAPPSVPALLQEHDALVMKPVSGGAGTSIEILIRHGGCLLLNGRELSMAELDAHLRTLDQVLVTRYSRNGEYAAAIAPRASNTVRVLTLWDVDTGAPFIAAAAQRFGLPRTYPIDNFHGGKGGISAAIDPVSGVLGRGATLGTDQSLRWYDAHPDSGAPITGVRVPFWEEVVATTLHAAAQLPHVPFVGWDLIVTEEGPSFLEANSPPGAMVWQVHGGLLRDPRGRRFFEVHGMIRPRRGVRTGNA